MTELNIFIFYDYLNIIRQYNYKNYDIIDVIDYLHINNYIFTVGDIIVKTDNKQNILNEIDKFENIFNNNSKKQNDSNKNYDEIINNMKNILTTINNKNITDDIYNIIDKFEKKNKNEINDKIKTLENNDFYKNISNNHYFFGNKIIKYSKCQYNNIHECELILYKYEKCYFNSNKNILKIYKIKIFNKK